MSPLDSIYTVPVPVGSVEAPQLSTHLNYLNYLWRNTRTLSFEYSNRVERSDTVSRSGLQDRINLAVLTYQSLQEEKCKVNETREYARVCSAWVAIKGYYLLFYLETLLLALIEADMSKLKFSHEGIRKFIRNICGASAFSSSFNELTKSATHSDCQTTGLQSGANLRGQLPDELRYKQVMKKLMEYSKEEFKRKNNIRRLSGAAAARFNQQSICLMDFFYWYRIKSNYRDLEFIAGENSSTLDLYSFYKMYNETATSIANGYERVINELFRKRTGEGERLIEL